MWVINPCVFHMEKTVSLSVFTSCFQISNENYVQFYNRNVLVWVRVTF